MRSNKFLRLGAVVRTLFAAHATRSPAFEDFRSSFFCAPDGRRDRLDVKALAALEGRERGLAERLLIDALPDARAVIGLGVIASERARPWLNAIFEQECARAQAARIAGVEDWSGVTLILAAEALWRIAPHSRYARVVIGRLRYAGACAERVDAAAALARMPTAEVDAALSEALDDGDALVRHYAARALLEIHGVEVDARAAQCMAYRVMASQEERRAAGRRDLAAAIVDHPLLHDARARARRLRDHESPGAAM